MDDYVYRVCELLRVVDGDTVDCRIVLLEQDVGFGLREYKDAAFRFRLAHVDTPEVYGALAVEAGKAAMDFTFNWLDERKDYLLVRTYKGSRAAVGIGDGAFGRWLGDFHTPEDEHLADALHAAGHLKAQ